jgi:DNA-binding MarR family transcriptional regulator
MGSHVSAAFQPKRSTRNLRAEQGRKIMNSLRRIVRDLRLGSRTAERQAGVSGAQLFVLQALSEGPAASLGELAERTLTDQSSVSVVVRKLIDENLVKGRAAAEDARRVELSLTPLGRRLLGRCPEPTQASLVAALEHLEPRELAALTQGLDALVRQMGDLEEGSPEMFFEGASAPSHTRRSRRDRD